MRAPEVPHEQPRGALLQERERAERRRLAVAAARVVVVIKQRLALLQGKNDRC